MLTLFCAAQATSLAEAGGSEGSMIGVNLSYGSQSSTSTQTSTQEQSQGSTLTAGNNLTINATDTDINVEGSQLQAGKDVGLSAARDINLFSGLNSQTLEGKNESHGASVGVGINFGQGANGLSLNASVNKGKGSESGNGTSHNETTVNAGNNLTINSGRDTTLTGAQANGEKVTMDVGRNLTLTSEQDSDNYDSKQQNASAGGSVSMGGGGGSVNLSRDKMHSTYDSVQEQTGLFAGAGGFDITVGEHTQLNGAVIGSTADASLNKLNTGTLGFSDIKNSAEYEVEHQSVGISSGGNIGGQFVGNMANGLLVGVNGSGSDSSTTKSAVSEGTITIRDKDNQKQDVDELSRDVEHANQTLSPIFDKEKEQNRLKEAQLIGEIGSQAMDIARTQGKIEATKAGKAELEKHGVQQPGKDATKEERAAYDKALTETAGYKTAQQKWGTGSAIQQGLQAATAAVQGLAGGDMAKALAGASAPYLAEVIHNMTTDPVTGKVNSEANLMAHAVLGAVISQVNGNGALAGASGAVVGEYIAQQMYPGVDRDKLSEDQRQTISALSTLAAGLAGGLTGDSSADTVAGAQAGKNAVENNFLSSKEARQLDKEMQDCKASGGDCGKVAEKYIEISNANSKVLAEACTGGGVACVTWEEIIQGSTNVANDAHSSQFRLDEKLKDPDAAALVNYLNGTDLQFLQENITTGDRVLDVVTSPSSWPVLVMGGKALVTNTVTNGKELLIAAGASATGSAVIQYGVHGEVKLSDVIGAGVIGAITAGKGYNPTVTWNAAGGYYQAELKGDDPFLGALLSKAGAATGYAAGNILKVPADKILNPVSKQYEWIPTGVWTITKPAPQNSLPSILGNAGNAAASGGFTEGMNEALKSKEGGNDE